MITALLRAAQHGLMKAGAGEEERERGNEEGRKEKESFGFCVVQLFTAKRLRIGLKNNKAISALCSSFFGGAFLYLY